MNESTEEKLKRLNIPWESSHLCDVPDGCYFWVDGERWKKVKTGKKASKVKQREQKWDNYLGVFMEKKKTKKYMKKNKKMKIKMLQYQNDNLVKRIKKLENLVYDFILATTPTSIYKSEKLLDVTNEVKDITNKNDLKNELYSLFLENEISDKRLKKLNIESISMINETGDEDWKPRLIVRYDDNTDKYIDGYENIIEYYKNILK